MTLWENLTVCWVQEFEVYEKTAALPLEPQENETPEM